MKEIGRIDFVNAVISRKDHSVEDPAHHSLSIDPVLLAQVLKEAGCQCDECRPHKSDCAVHNEPAFKKGGCDCRKRSGLESLRGALKISDDDNIPAEKSYYILSEAVSTFLENNR